MALEIREEHGVHKPDRPSMLWAEGWHGKRCWEPGQGDLKPGREEEGEDIFFWKMIEEIRVRIIAREIRQALAWKK